MSVKSPVQPVNPETELQSGQATDTVKILHTVSDLQAFRDQLSPAGKGKTARLGFVPTMGALHEGHMVLVRQALRDCQQVIVSIFVNPTQFAPGEDFNKYPRTFEKDLDLCRREGVHAIYFPSVDEMYPYGPSVQTQVVPPEELTERLCGAFRPGHFTGVATVVTKLFGMVRSDNAYFGEKDYQQLAVIRQMVRDLDLPVTIWGVPTARDTDGLAMSSRNVYLNAEQRSLAPTLYQTLCQVKGMIREQGIPVAEALDKGRARISSLPGVTLQYLEVCNPLTLQPQPQSSLNDAMVILVAAKFGEVRLIDNIIVA